MSPGFMLHGSYINALHVKEVYDILANGNSGSSVGDLNGKWLYCVGDAEAAQALVLPDIIIEHISMFVS